MTKFITVQIPKPCGEDPANMSPTSKGSYCNSCKKEVIDFRDMSDEAVAAFFKRNTGDTCGRFLPKQLNRNITLPPKRIPWLKYFMTISLPAMLLSIKSTAQRTFNRYNEQPGLYPRQISLKPTLDKMITGTVCDEDGKPLEFISVTITGTHIGTSTDSAGRFSLFNEGGGAEICFSSIGYIKCIIPAEYAYNCTIVMKTDHALADRTWTVGCAVVVRHIVMSRGLPFQKIQKDSLHVFPNPASANKALNFTLDQKKIAPVQEAEIFFANGTLIQKETLHMDKNKGILQLRDLPKGFYIIRITDGKTGTHLTKEFIVE